MEWSCSACTLLNPFTATVCSACANKRGEGAGGGGAAPPSSGSPAKAPFPSPPSPSSAAAGTHYGEKLTAIIQTIVEQRPFEPGEGGVASTDPLSFAAARAQLVLLAFQAYPMLREERFKHLRVCSLVESHPLDGTTGVADEAAVKVQFRDQAEQQKGLDIHIPVRSSRDGKLQVQEIGVLRKFMWRALVLGATGVFGRSEGELAAEAEALEKLYREKFFDKAPKDVVHLVYMGVMAQNYTQEHAAFVDARVQAAAAKNAPQGRAPRAEPRCSALGLWWPVPKTAITFAQMQQQQAELKCALAVAEKAEKEEVRLKRLAALEKRQSAGGGGGGGGK